MTRYASFAVLAALALSLAACGGNGGGAATEETPVTPTPEEVMGVTTPSSVSVVTAKNAG